MPRSAGLGRTGQKQKRKLTKGSASKEKMQVGFKEVETVPEPPTDAASSRDVATSAASECRRQKGEGPPQSA